MLKKIYKRINTERKERLKEKDNWKIWNKIMIKEEENQERY